MKQNKLTEREKRLVQALKDCLETIQAAMDNSEGDTFGVYHNQAMDNMSAAEVLIVQVEKGGEDE